MPKVEIYWDEYYPYYDAVKAGRGLEPQVEFTDGEWEHHQHCREVFYSWQKWLEAKRHST